MNNSENPPSQNIAEFSRKAYLDYSMYVILDRALPFVGDGLKPVQRRIIYAMSELGLQSGAKHKKSARTVGDVLGKFHPHGDSACYEAMVLMAQPFSYRYPFIDGQGNWGAPDDPKSFAAMRYTESRLSAYADLLLAELNQGTVDWIPNFDGSLDEPKHLSAKVPNLLLNGASGIAVGMATDIPPHNLSEVVSACIRLLEKPSLSLTELMEILPAPDYPTNAKIITPKTQMHEIYESGTGAVRMRADWHLENNEIVLDALPYQASGAKIIAQIAAQMRAKKLPLVEDIRDESDHSCPTRIVLALRSQRVDAERLMSHLFATTELEKKYRVNMNMIGLDGKPQVKPLLEFLREWLIYRKKLVVRRLEKRLEKIIERLHILDGLMIAYLNLDRVIEIIRFDDNPKEKLMHTFKLTAAQVDAILALRLRHLAKLEEIKIREEHEKLSAEKTEIEQLLASDSRLKILMKKEFREIIKNFKDPRRTEILSAAAEAVALSENALLPVENMTLVLSKKGWIRAAKGHDIDPGALGYKAGDGYLRSVKAKSNQMAVFLDSSGSSFALEINTLPSARGQGEPLTGRLNPAPGVAFVDVLAAPEDRKIALAANTGYGFICDFKNLVSATKQGKRILSLPENATALPAAGLENLENDYLAVATNVGRLLIFAASELPILSRGRGNKLIHIPKQNDDERVVGIAALGENDGLRIHSGKRHITIKSEQLQGFFGKRARRGSYLPKGYRNVRKIENSRE